MPRWTRRQTGIGLVAAGAIAIVIGFVGLLGSEDAPIAASTTAPDPSSTTAPETTTSVATTAPSSTTTTVATTTTTTTAPTTTTRPASDRIEAFAAEFASALADGDTSFAYARLHPTVLAIFGAELCEAYVDREVALIQDYRIVGPVEGPTRRVYETPDGDVGVDVYEAAVTFTFQGQTVEATGAYAFVDGEVHWFTACR
jgi:hypothetical protein